MKMLFKTRSQFATLMQTLSQHHWWWTLLPSRSSSSFHHFIFLLIFFTSPHLITLSSPSSPLPPPPITPTITDLIVNVGENTLLECADYHHQELSLKETSPSFPSSKPPTLKYLWCRYEEDWVTGTTATATSTAKLLQTGNKNSKNNKDSSSSRNCFEGDRFFVASEGKVSTVVYRCKILNPKNEKLIASRFWKLYVDAFESVLAKRETMSSSYSFSQQPIVQQSVERSADNFDSPPSPPSPSPRSYSPPPNRLSPSSIRCPPPRCKPYASVVSARCGRIELAIRYPATQYGYNRSADHWGTISCGGGDGGEEEGDKSRRGEGGYYRSYSSERSPPPITGYQLWLIGYGIVKKFKPNDPIVMEDLVPGKRYCFNGWAVNRCGSGPVFTLEGVCAENGEDCGSSSDEHCELDVDYSY